MVDVSLDLLLRCVIVSGFHITLSPYVTHTKGMTYPLSWNHRRSTLSEICDSQNPQGGYVLSVLYHAEECGPSDMATNRQPSYQSSVNHARVG